MAFDDAIEFGVNAGKLLVIPLDAGAQFANLSIDFADFLLHLRHVRSTVAAQPAQVLLQSNHLVGDFPPACLAKGLRNGLVKFSDGKRLRLNLALFPTLCASIEKLFHLVPPRDQEEQTADPGSQLNSVRGHGVGLSGQQCCAGVKKDGRGLTDCGIS